MTGRILSSSCSGIKHTYNILPRTLFAPLNTTSCGLTTLLMFLNLHIFRFHSGYTVLLASLFPAMPDKLRKKGKTGFLFRNRGEHSVSIMCRYSHKDAEGGLHSIQSDKHPTRHEVRSTASIVLEEGHKEWGASNKSCGTRKSFSMAADSKSFVHIL